MPRHIKARAERGHTSIFEGVEVVPYIDTAELFFDPEVRERHLDNDRVYRKLDRFTQLHSGTYLKPVWNKDRFLLGYKLILQLPSIATIEAANRVQEKEGGALSCFHLAIDFVSSPKKHGDVRHALNRGLLLKWRRPGPTHDEENGFYAQEYAGRKRPSRNVAYYWDRHCKITGEADCNHVELRMLRPGYIRKAGYGRIKDLLSLNPREWFSHHLDVVEFTAAQFDAFKRRIVRLHIRTNPIKEGKHVSKHFAGYMASRPRRLSGLLDRIYRGRAMIVKSRRPNVVERLTRIDMSSLIPTALSFRPGIEVKGKSGVEGVSTY